MARHLDSTPNMGVALFYGDMEDGGSAHLGVITLMMIRHDKHGSSTNADFVFVSVNLTRFPTFLGGNCYIGLYRSYEYIRGTMVFRWFHDMF